MTITLAGCRSDIRRPLELIQLDMDIQKFADEAYANFYAHRPKKEYAYRLDYSIHEDELWYLTDSELKGSEIQRVVDEFNSLSPHGEIPESQTTRALFVSQSKSTDIAVMQIDSKYRLESHRSFFRIEESFQYRSSAKPGIVIPERLVAIIKLDEHKPKLLFDKFSSISKIFNTKQIFDEFSTDSFNVFLEFCDVRKVEGISTEEMFNKTITKPQKEKIARLCSPHFLGETTVMEKLTDVRITEIERIFMEKDIPFPSSIDGKFVLRTDFTSTELQVLLDVLTDRYFLSLLDDSLRRTTTSHPALS